MQLQIQTLFQETVLKFDQEFLRHMTYLDEIVPTVMEQTAGKSLDSSKAISFLFSPSYFSNSLNLAKGGSVTGVWLVLHLKPSAAAKLWKQSTIPPLRSLERLVSSPLLANARTSQPQSVSWKMSRPSELACCDLPRSAQLKIWSAPPLVWPNLCRVRLKAAGCGVPCVSVAASQSLR